MQLFKVQQGKGSRILINDVVIDKEYVISCEDSHYCSIRYKENNETKHYHQLNVCLLTKKKSVSVNYNIPKSYDDNCDSINPIAVKQFFSIIEDNSNKVQNSIDCAIYGIANL